MSVEEFLFPNEEIQITFRESDLVEYAKTKYQVFFTNQRLVLFARTGLIFKRDNIVSIAYQDIIQMDYREKGLRKKGHALVATPLMKYTFAGNPQVVREMIKYLQRFIPRKDV